MDLYNTASVPLTGGTLTGTLTFADGSSHSSTGLTMVKSITSTLGSLSASAPMIAGTQTWNSAAITFKGLTLDVIDTSSSAGSVLVDLTVNSNVVFRVTKTGGLSVGGNLLGQQTSALPAGGSASSGVRIWTSGPFYTSGSGAPTAAFPIGSVYARSDGSDASTRLYSATSSSGAWTSVTTAT